MGRSIPLLPPLWLHGMLKGDPAYNFIFFLRAVRSAHNSRYANRNEVYQSFSDKFCCLKRGFNISFLGLFQFRINLWHYGSPRQLVGVFRQGIKSSQALYLNKELHTRKSHERISVSKVGVAVPAARRCWDLTICGHCEGNLICKCYISQSWYSCWVEEY